MQKRIPYSVGNYEALVNGGYYFIDKTAFIRPLEKYLCPILLRPRRFGKSLWCSMLECYYDISRKNVFEKLFVDTGTDIGRHPTPLRNAYLVLKLNFSTVNASTALDGVEDSFDRTFTNALDEFLRRYEMYFVDADDLRNQPNATEKLKRLISIVSGEGMPRLYIIIDEYDNFTNQLLASMREADYSSLTTADSFLRSFFKALKAGVEDGAVAKVFMAGVLPVTIDDLTSGFNIGQNISLSQEFLTAVGFTHNEVVGYVSSVFEDCGFDQSLLPRVISDMQAYYDGYRFSPDSEMPLYNSSICNKYLWDLMANGGKLPAQTADTNVKPDVAWLAAMSRRGTGVADFLMRLLGRNEPIAVSLDKAYEQISAGKFFSSDYFPICLYYLGLLTFKDEFTLTVPNLSVERVILDYYQEIHSAKYSALSSPCFSEALRSFVQTRDWAALFGAFWTCYIKRVLPAKLFSYVNEFFFQVTFFGFCIDRLSTRYSIRIEENHFSGQSDFLAVPMPGEKDKIIVLEFKYASKAKAKQDGAGLESAAEPVVVKSAKAQVLKYIESVRLQHPDRDVCGGVIYIVGNTGWRFYNV